MADLAANTVIRCGIVSVLALLVFGLGACGPSCPEGSVFERGEPVWVPIYDPAIRTTRMQAIFPNGRCVEEARRG